ncbi:DUF559 domain-containing protein [Kineosporia sp. A_224]|uniref:DUF559 domain-containing protein n=1 Tax=Kineosporia sp. A_224 TaxID=1962180 RepID=UPI00117B2190|nr:DUF559 domain-containing protein [Kineosporia sp. A_224]
MQENARERRLVDRTVRGRPARRVDARRPPGVAQGQCGVFTQDQALAEGLTVRQVRRRCSSGAWRSLTSVVLTAEPDPLPVAARAWTAVLTWPEAIVCRRSAAVLWGFPVRDDGTCHVVAKHGRHAAGFAVHVVRPIDDDVVRHRGLPTTTARRTALDCLATMPAAEGLDLFAWLLTRRLLSRADVAADIQARRGRWGVAKLTELLEVTASGAVSGAERELHVVLEEAGIDGWRANAEIRDADGPMVVDLLFEAARLVVEVDGMRAHSGREAFVADRARQNRVVNAGYSVLRFTWWDISERPGHVVRTIRRALLLP